MATSFYFWPNRESATICFINLETEEKEMKNSKTLNIKLDKRVEKQNSTGGFSIELKFGLF